MAKHDYNFVSRLFEVVKLFLGGGCNYGPWWDMMRFQIRSFGLWDMVLTYFIFKIISNSYSSSQSLLPYLPLIVIRGNLRDIFFPFCHVDNSRISKNIMLRRAMIILWKPQTLWRPLMGNKIRLNDVVLTHWLFQVPLYPRLRLLNLQIFQLLGLTGNIFKWIFKCSFSLFFFSLFSFLTLWLLKI